MLRTKALQFTAYPELKVKAAARNSPVKLGYFLNVDLYTKQQVTISCSPTTASPAGCSHIQQQALPSPPGNLQHPPLPAPHPNPKCPPSLHREPSLHPVHLSTSHQPCQKVKELNTSLLCYTITHHKQRTAKACPLCFYCTYKTWDLKTIFFSPTYWHLIY